MVRTADAQTKAAAVERLKANSDAHSQMIDRLMEVRAASSAGVGPAAPARDDLDVDELLRSTPFFMNELPKADGQEEENVALEALRSLVYEGTPDEIAENLRLQANSYFKRRAFKEALGFYSQAIREVGDTMTPEGKRTLLSNRAAAHLELSNFGSCIRDCAAALQISSASDATTRKVLFRSSRALVKLDKLDQAADALQRLRALGPDPSEAAEQAVIALQDKVVVLIRSKAERKERLRRAQEEEQRAAFALTKAIFDLGIVLPKTWTPKAAETAAPADVKPPHFADSSSTTIAFPVFMLRPLLQPPTRDLVLDWHDDVTFGEQLEPNFGPELEGHEIYVVTGQRRVLKVGKKLTIRALAKAARKADDGLTLAGGWALEFYLVPKDRSAGWIAEMKKA